jgi:hypothetical protein
MAQAVGYPAREQAEDKHHEAGSDRRLGSHAYIDTDAVRFVQSNRAWCFAPPQRPRQEYTTTATAGCAAGGGLNHSLDGGELDEKSPKRRVAGSKELRYHVVSAQRPASATTRR